MIVKLDSSKTIMLDTRGPEVRTRNKEELILKKGKEIPIEHAEFFKDSYDILYIDYPQTQEIPEGTLIDIDN
jgi:pyruvate kinase